MEEAGRGVEKDVELNKIQYNQEKKKTQRDKPKIKYSNINLYANGHSSKIHGKHGIQTSLSIKTDIKYYLLIDIGDSYPCFS